MNISFDISGERFEFTDVSSAVRGLESLSFSDASMDRAEDFKNAHEAVFNALEADTDLNFEAQDALYERLSDFHDDVDALKGRTLTNGLDDLPSQQRSVLGLDAPEAGLQHLTVDHGNHRTATTLIMYHRGVLAQDSIIGQVVLSDGTNHPLTVSDLVQTYENGALHSSNLNSRGEAWVNHSRVSEYADNFDIDRFFDSDASNAEGIILREVPADTGLVKYADTVNLSNPNVNFASFLHRSIKDVSPIFNTFDGDKTSVPDAVGNDLDGARDSHDSRGDIKGGIRGMAVQGVAVIAAVGVFMAATPSTAMALPIEAQGPAINQDYELAAEHILESGEYSGLLLRAGLIAEEMGQPSEKGVEGLAEFIAAKANGDMPQAIAALSEGFGVDEATIQAALDGDISTLAPIVAAGLIGDEAVQHFAAAQEASLGMAFNTASISPVGLFGAYAKAYVDGDLDQLVDMQMHQVKGGYAAASNVLDFDPVKAWQGEDSVMGSVDAVIHETAGAAWRNTGGAAIDLAGMAIDAGYVAFGSEPPRFGPTPEQIAANNAANNEFFSVHDGLAALAERGVSNDAPLEVQHFAALYSNLIDAEASMNEYSFGMERTQREMALVKAEDDFTAYYDELGPEGLDDVKGYIAEEMNPATAAPQQDLVASIPSPVAPPPGMGG